jgi:hypothetical protein
MKTIVVIATMLGLNGCEFATPDQQVAQSKILGVMAANGAGNPERYTREGLYLWFGQHEPVAQQIASLCAPGVLPDMDHVFEAEHLVCATVAEQRTLHNAFGYAAPVVSGKGW